MIGYWELMETPQPAQHLVGEVAQDGDIRYQRIDADTEDMPRVDMTLISSGMDQHVREAPKARAEGNA